MFSCIFLFFFASNASVLKSSCIIIHNPSSLSNSFLPPFHLCSLADEHPGLELEELVHEVDEWEVARDRIKLENMIGSGAFGAVWKATLKQSDKKHGAQTVAAKHFTRESVQHITLDTFIFECEHDYALDNRYCGWPLVSCGVFKNQS